MATGRQLREIAESLQALGYLSYALAVREAALEVDEVRRLRSDCRVAADAFERLEAKTANCGWWRDTRGHRGETE